MTPASQSPTRAIFRRPDAPILAVMGGLLVGGAMSGAVVAVLLMQVPDLWSATMTCLAAVGVSAIGLGMLNAWRQPMLVVEPDRLVVPTFFGLREIAVSPGQRVGEVLATPTHGGNRAGGIEANRFVHFFALDGAGQPVLLLDLHRATPMIDDIRRALREVAGLRVGPVPRDHKAPRPRPDMSAWHEA